MAYNNPARLYQTQSVLTTSPGQLVLMLYDGALRFMGNALDAFAEEGDNLRKIERINTGLTKAQNIIYELQGNLDLEAGGEYATNLHRLYDYYIRRLFEGNVQKDPKPVQEVERLLRQIRDGWAEMLKSDEAQQFAARSHVA